MYSMGNFRGQVPAAFHMEVEMNDQFWVIANGFDYVAAVAGSVGFNPPFDPVDFPSQTATFDPEWSTSLGAQYNADLPCGYGLSLRVDYYWQEEIYTRLYNRPVDKVDAWDVWNAQAKLLSPQASWYVRAYVKNIADDDNFVGMYLGGAASGLFTNIFTMEPRTYGLAIGYNFQ